METSSAVRLLLEQSISVIWGLDLSYLHFRKSGSIFLFYFFIK